jgi:hypothetical protein
MDLPHSKSLEEVSTILIKVGETEGLLAALKSQLDALPARVARELTTEIERLAAARYLYWHTDIPASKIAHGLLRMNSKGGAAAEFLVRIGPFTTEWSCAQCNTPIVCSRREELIELRRNKGKHAAWWLRTRLSKRSPILCEPCIEVTWQQRTEKTAGNL